MGSAVGGWLALGAFIALIGNLARHDRRLSPSFRFARNQHRAGGWLMVIGAIVIAWGFAPVLATIHFGTPTTITVAAPELAPKVTVPPVTEAPAPQRSDSGFWLGLSTPAKFFLVFLGIFALGCLIGFGSQSSDTATQILGGIVGFIIAAVGVVGMFINGGIWLFS